MAESKDLIFEEERLRELLRKEIEIYEAMDVDDINRFNVKTHILEFYDGLIKIEHEKNDKKSKIGNLIKDVGLGIGGLALSGLSFAKGLKFEETGTFTSTTMKNLLSGIKIRK